MADVIFGGWSGGGTINGSRTFLTSASVEEQHTPAYYTSVNIPDKGSTAPFSRYIYAEGTRSSSGSMSFDLSSSSSGVENLLTRGVEFNVSFGDGDNGVGGSLSGCYVTSLSFSGSSNGLVTASVSFVSSEPFSGGTSIAPDVDEEPIGYWKSGDGLTRDWSLSMNCNVQPMYANTSSTWPGYMKVGTVDYSLSITSYDQIGTGDSISIGIGSKTIRGVKSGEGTSFNGSGDFGTYTSTFESTSGPSGSGDVLIS